VDGSDLRGKVLAAARGTIPKYEPFDIPELGQVFIKRLNTGERDRFERSTPGSTIRRATTLVHCCFDERGARVFDDGDAEMLEDLDQPWVDQLVKKALVFNGYTGDDATAAIRKNSNGQVVNS